jgi:uncharacterized protein (TIGR03067 family)
MRIILRLLAFIFVLTVCGGTGVRADAKADVATELAKFQGTWTYETVISAGMPDPADTFYRWTVTFEGSKQTVKVAGDLISIGTLKIDPSKSPKTIDVTTAQGPNKGAIMLGIYEINGDTLKVCFDTAGKKRPTELKSPLDSVTELQVLKRRKPALAMTAPWPPIPVPKGNAKLDEETLKCLRRFVIAASKDDASDESVLKAFNELSRQVKDEHIATVEGYAVTDEAKPVAFAFGRLLVERKRYDAAADVFVTALANFRERQYAMWKWWEYSLGERKDYKELSRQIADALLRQFAKGSPDRKLIIAEVFGKGPTEAKMTVEEFQRAIKQ